MTDSFKLLRLPRTRGFSLTELLVAMVIGLFLLGGLVALMANSKKNYAQQDYSARLQENGRFAVQFISYDVRMAGYYGCSNDVVNDDTITPFTIADATPNEVTILRGEGYDMDEEVIVTSVVSSAGSTRTWQLSELPNDWAVGDELLVADCGSAVRTSITAVDAANDRITIDKNYSRIFDPSINEGGPITVRHLVSNAYSIATGASNVLTLMRNGQEVVEGVESLRFLYQDTSGAAFVEGSSAIDTPQAVQVGALLRSISNENEADREFGSGLAITVDDGVHQLLDQNLDLADLRGQRRVFTTTLAVRNRPR